MYIFWRPFISIQKSVEALDDNQLYIHCLTGAYVALQKFLKGDEDFRNEPFQKFYWNNGKPAFADIIDYLEYAQEEWYSRGGEPYGIKKIIEKASNSEYAENRITWSDENCLNHAMILMNLNFFWYKRFFMEIKYKQTKENIFFVNGKPRSLNLEDLPLRELEQI